MIWSFVINLLMCVAWDTKRLNSSNTWCRWNIHPRNTWSDYTHTSRTKLSALIPIETSLPIRFCTIKQKRWSLITIWVDFSRVFHAADPFQLQFHQNKKQGNVYLLPYSLMRTKSAYFSGIFSKSLPSIHHWPTKTPGPTGRR